MILMLKLNGLMLKILKADNVNEILKDVDGILVPGGFGDRGIEGKITAIKWARENKKPFLGICLRNAMCCY